MIVRITFYVHMYILYHTVQSTAETHWMPSWHLY